MLYLSGCFCCLSGSLTGCVQPGEGPGRTGWASHDPRGRRWGLSPCSSSPSLHDGSRGQGASGLSGCLFFCWCCGSPSSCTKRWQAVSQEVNRSITGLVKSIKRAPDVEQVLLSLLGGGTPCADQRHHHHHHHGDGSHRHHDDDQKVAVLLRGDAAVRRTHLTDGGLWKVHREGRLRRESYLFQLTAAPAELLLPPFNF